MFYRYILTKSKLFFKKFSKENLRNFIDKEILNSNQSNLKLAFAIGLGLLMSIFPVWGFQTLFALLLASLFKLNRLIVVVLTNISIPPLIPFFLYVSFLFGGIIVNKSDTINFSMQFSLDNLQNGLFQYYIGAVLFSVLFGFFGVFLSFTLLSLFRRDKIRK